MAWIRCVLPSPTPPYTNSGLYDVGCSATCMPPARASWFALPDTKVAKLNPGLRLACSPRLCGRWRGFRSLGRRRGGRTRPLGRVGDREDQAERLPAGPCRHFFDPGRVALLDPLQDEAVRCDQTQPFLGLLEAQRPDPGIELLRREFALEGFQATLPECGGRHDRDTGEAPEKKIGHRKEPVEATL